VPNLRNRLVEVLAITGLQRAVLRILLAHFGKDVSTDLIADCIYVNTKASGPLSARENIKVYAHHLRRILKPYGLTVAGKRWGAYRLDWIDAPALRELMGREAA
jgi:hypothetical protein